MTREEAIHYLNSTGWLEERERIAINFLDSIGCFEEHDKIMTESADRPRGYWKHNTTYKNLVFCSECDMPYEVGMIPRNFCPNCGAKMNVEWSKE